MRHHQPDQYKYYRSPRRRKEKGAGRLFEGKMAQNFPNLGKEMDIQSEEADDTTLMTESEELKSLLRKVKEESEKAGLKFNIQKTKIMASSPITSWQIDGQTKETVTDFFFGSKITADGECRHEIKTLAPWKKSYDKPRQHIKKQRHYFANKGLCDQGYGSSSSHVWM